MGDGILVQRRGYEHILSAAERLQFPLVTPGTGEGPLLGASDALEKHVTQFTGLISDVVLLTGHCL